MPPTASRLRENEIRLVVQRLARLIRAESADGELGDAKRSVLFRLDEHGALSLSALSELERVTPPSMNRTVGVLEERGYLTRTPAADDARRVSIALTDAGRAFVRETRRKRDAWLAARLARLDATERDILDAAVPVLRKLGES